MPMNVYEQIYFPALKRFLYHFFHAKYFWRYFHGWILPLTIQIITTKA